jgi:hypothetical protein
MFMARPDAEHGAGASGQQQAEGSTAAECERDRGAQDEYERAVRTVLVEASALAGMEAGGRETAMASGGIRGGASGAGKQSKVDEIDERFHLRG